MSGGQPGLLAQFARFGLVGVANTVIGSGLVLLLTWAGWNPFVANVTGYVVGTLFSYFANARWTFNARPTGPALVRFMGVVAVSYVVNLGVLAAALHAGWGDMLAQLPAMASFTLCNFLGQRYFTFAPPRTEP